MSSFAMSFPGLKPQRISPRWSFSKLRTARWFQAGYMSPTVVITQICGAKAEIAGLQEVFAHVGVIADPPMLKGRRYGNIILIASGTELPAAHQEIASRLLGGAVPAHYKGPAWTNKFAAGGQARHDPPSEATAPSQ